MRKTLIVLVVLMIGCPILAFAAPLTAGGKNLDELIGTDTLVTVKLKASSAEDKNLRVNKIYDFGVSFVDEAGAAITYLTKDIGEITIQDARAEKTAFKAGGAGGLLPGEQRILDAAVAQAAKFFEAGNRDQSVKRNAACVLLAAGSGEQKNKAQEYLVKLHEGNHAVTSMQAALALLLAGKQDLIKTDLIDASLNGGNIQARIGAVTLCGMMKYKSSEPQLFRMLQDRRANLSNAAALAMARLGYDEIVPTLVSMLSERNPSRGLTASIALSTLKSKDAVEPLKALLNTAEGFTRLYAASVLIDMNNAEARTIMRDGIMKVPTLEVPAAMTLAVKGDPIAMRLLREKLGERFDEKADVLVRRAAMSAALVEGGDRTKIYILQSLLRTPYPEVSAYTCALMGNLGMKNLLPNIRPAIESGDDKGTMIAAQAAIAMAFPEINARYKDIVQWATISIVEEMG